MANRFAIANGNWSSTATWSTSYNGAGGASVPGVGDDAVLNNKAVAMDVSGGCDNVRSQSVASSVAGGTLTLANGVTLTAAVHSHPSAYTVLFAGSGTANIVGSCLGLGGVGCVSFTGSGTLNITGNVGQYVTGNSGSNQAVLHGGAGSMTVTGNVTGAGNTKYGILKTASGPLTVVGNIIMLSGGGSPAIQISFPCSVNVTGSVIAANNEYAGILPAISSDQTVTLTVTGDISASSLSNGVRLTGNSAVLIHAGSLYDASNGRAAVMVPTYYAPTSPANKIHQRSVGGVFGQSYTLATLDHVAIGHAQVTDVRDGVAYAAGSLVGTCAVPDPESVAHGIPVDDTTGTAVLTTAALLSAFPRLTNAATIESVGQQLADALTPV